VNLKKLAAWSGIAYPLLQMISQGLIQIGGAEPPFTAPAADILAFFQNRDPNLAALGGYLSVLSVIPFIWFAAALWDELRGAEGGSGWLSAVALGSGLVTAAALLDPGGWGPAVFRVNEGLDPGLARALFDEGNLNFANFWIALASMLLAAGAVLRSSDRHPVWLAWSAVILGIGFIVARFFWTSQAAFTPYVFFWLWMIVMGIRMARPGRTAAQSAP
jgi:hypothetical protein